jgi:hypothetical protein
LKVKGAAVCENDLNVRKTLGGSMNKSRFVLLTVSMAILALGLCFIPTLHAQTLSSTAALSGTVSDPAGARVQKATVKLTDSEKGVARTFTTGSAGEFSFALLPAGAYTLEASAPNFKTSRQDGIVLHAGDSLVESISLSIGASEEVTVTESGPLLQTEDANVGTEIASKQVEELPLNVRNVIGLVMLNSSVNNQVQQQNLTAGGADDMADQDMSFLSFGGGLMGTTAWLLDGGWNVAPGWGGTVYVPAVDDVQEFKVTNNSFSAEYGWSTGNVINMVTKSGTSDFHIVMDEYLRNPKLDANLYFNKLANLPWIGDHRNQFGVAGGGPLYIPGVYKQRNKTFFFANYEGLRLSNASTGSGNMPSTAQEAGDFSAEYTATVIGTDCLGRNIYSGEIFNPYTTRQPGGACGATGWVRDPYTNNKIGTGGSGTVDSLAHTFASGNYWPASNTTGKPLNWYASASAPSQSNEYGIRIDHHFTDNTSMYGRWMNKHESKNGEPAFYGASDIAGPGDTNPDNRYSVATGASHVFSSSFVMNANAEYSRWIEGNVVQSGGFKDSTLGLAGILDSYSGEFPEVSFGAGNYMPLGPTQGYGVMTNANNVGTASLDFNKTFGKHSLSFGYMGILTQLFGGRIAPVAFHFSNDKTSGIDSKGNLVSGTGDAFASFIAGAGSSGSAGFNALPATSYHMHGVYLQDDWKASRKLTLNLGFRYEMQTPFTERHNWQAAFDFNALNPISASGTPAYGAIVYSTPGHRNLYQYNLDDVAPRVGFAYAAMPKLVFRGGFGLYYARNFLPYGGIPAPGFSSQTTWSATAPNGVQVQTPLASAFATDSNILPITGNALQGMTYVGQALSAVNAVRPDPRVKQYSLGLQYAITPNDLVDVNYVGNLGTRILLGGMNYGQLNPSHLALGETALTANVANPFSTTLSNLGLPAMACQNSNGTLAAGQMMEPYPEFCGGAFAQQEPVGISRYDSLQMAYNHRITQGLIFMASYTYSKFITDAGDALGWSSINSGGSAIRNYYDLKADRTVDSTDIPQSLVLNYVYELPVGRGKKFGGNMNAVEDAVAGGWQISGITHLQKGFPLSIGNGGQNQASVWGGNQHATFTGASFSPTSSCTAKYCIFNPAAFEQSPALPAGPATGAQIAATFGNVPRYLPNLRAPGYLDEDLGIQKWFNLPAEKFRLQFTAQLFNAFNHANFLSPDTNIGDGVMGQSTGTMGARQIQLALKLVR